MTASKNMAVQPSENGVLTYILDSLRRFQRTDAANKQTLKIDSLPVLPRSTPKADCEFDSETCEVEILFELEDENDFLDLVVQNYSESPVDVMVEPMDA